MLTTNATDVIKNITYRIKFPDRYISETDRTYLSNLKQVLDSLRSLTDIKKRKIIPSIRLRNAQIHNLKSSDTFENIEDNLSIVFSKLIYSSGRFGIHGYFNEICRTNPGFKVEGFRYCDDSDSEDSHIRYVYDISFNDWQISLSVNWAGIDLLFPNWEFSNIYPDDVSEVNVSPK